MVENIKFQYWNNMRVEVVKIYPLFRKKKIRVLHTGNVIIVDEYTIINEKEGAISIAWLEEQNA